MESLELNTIQDGEITNDVVFNGFHELIDEEYELDNDFSNDRPMRKAKRLLTRQTSEGDNTTNNVQINKKVLFMSKNCRKSRDGRGRGLPKKGGAGGKGVWGKPGEELGEECNTIDSHDPNYDSDSLDDENLAFEKVCPKMTREDFEVLVDPVVMEYFEHGDCNDVSEQLLTMNIDHLKRNVVEFLVSKSLDYKDHHRELISTLISVLYSKVLSSEDIADGFDDVLCHLADLAIDIPDADGMVGKFIARAVADDCLPPKFITRHKLAAVCQHTTSALNYADVLLNEPLGISQLDDIWGSGGGCRPLKLLVKKIVMLLKEYLSFDDIKVATDCLTELNVPHFHHEVVYESTLIVLKDASEHAGVMMVKLLQSLAEASIISPHQFEQGFRRVFELIPDICLDVPNAYVLLEDFAALCRTAGFMSESVFKDLPQRGRKRFVSEGDGGLVKGRQV